MRAHVRLAIILLLLLFPFSAFALSVEEQLSDPALEKEAKELFHEIRCMVCQSETIADSHSEVASDMRRDIRKWLKEGISQDEIKKRLVSSYGDFILMKPPLNKGTILLWFGPWIILIIGAVGVYYYFRHNVSGKNR